MPTTRQSPPRHLGIISRVIDGTIADGLFVIRQWLAGRESGYTASQWTFDLSDSGGGTYPGAAIFLHPDWISSGGDLTAGADIALLRLNGYESTIAPATINTANTNEVGQTATHVGYGRSGTGSTGMNTNAGTKRAGNNIVDLTGASVSGFNNKTLFEDFDSGLLSDNWSGSQTPLDLEYLIASGDSGGPMFIDFGSGELLSGVHSFISSVDGVTNPITATSVDRYASPRTRVGLAAPSPPMIRQPNNKWMISR